MNENQFHNGFVIVFYHKGRQPDQFIVMIRIIDSLTSN